MISAIVSRLVILVFGKLYPAYASYKAVRTKDVKEYVKWMMYWIVFALFTFVETFTDLLLSFWFPFYYELKIIVVLWLLSPATRGSSILYRKFVHPTFTKREHEIDDAIRHAKAQGYKTILQLGARGVDYARYVIMQTAIKGLQGAPLRLEPFTQTRTTVDGAPPAGERNEHIPQYANGLFEPDNLEHLDEFQYSDDEDFIPPPAVKAEMEVEEEEAEPVEEKRPKRRSARSRKQKQTVHYDEDFDD